MSDSSNADLFSRIDIDAAFKTLESLASRFPEISSEYQVIALATKALYFTYELHVRDSFRMFMDRFGGDLTEEEKEHLKRMNIDLAKL